MSTFEEFYAKQPKPKRSTFVGFHTKRGPLLRNSTLNQKSPFFSDFTLKRSTSNSEEFHAKAAKPKTSSFVRFHAKKVHFCGILR